MTSIDRHLHTGFETWQQNFIKIKPVEKILPATAMSLNFQPFHRGHLTKNTVCDIKTRQGSMNSPAENIYRRQDFLHLSCEGAG